MFPIEQSAFLQALGRAIGNSLWQMAAIWLIYAAVTSLFTLSASRKYQFATVASMVGFVWFAITFFYNYVNAPEASFAPVYTFSDSNETVNRSSFVNQVLFFYHSVLASLKSLSPYISCAYLLVFLLLGVRLVNGFRQVRFFATQGLGKVDIQWRLFVQRNAEILQITQKVKVFTSHYVQSPLTMGFWKPIILLPVASLNSLNTQQVEAILLHELAHIRRHDYLINIFVQIAEICLFFNPFMRLLLKQIRQERENSCDDYVLQFQYSAKDYVKALLTIEKNNAATLLALSAKDNQSFQLLNRVKRMVAPQPHAFNYRQQLYMLLLLTILGLGFTVIVPKPKIKTPVASESQLYKANNLPKTITETKIHTQPVPAAPAAFDLVKTIQGIRSFAENIDLKEVEQQGKEWGEKAEAIGKAYGEQLEKNMQPYIAEVTNWADKFSENNEALEKLEAAAREFENQPLRDRMAPLASIDEYMAPAILKLNEAMKTFPKINVTVPPVNMVHIMPAAPGFTAPLAAGVNVTSPRIVLNANGNARTVALSRLRAARDKMSQEAQELEKGQLEIKRAVEEARVQYREQVKSQISAFHQQDDQMAYHFNGVNARVLNKIKVEKSTCPTEKKDIDDEDDEETGSDDASSAKSRSKSAKALTYTLKLPELLEFKKLGKNFHFEWNNPAVIKEKRTKNHTEKKVIISGDDEDNSPVTLEDLKDLNIDTDDIKTIDIQQQKRSKNGKEENFVIIRIIPSR